MIFPSVLSDDRPLVPLQYGGYVYGNRDSNGGLVMAAPDFARFLAAFDLGDSNPIKDATYPGNEELRFSGFFGKNVGHRSLAFRDKYNGSDLFSFVIFTNFTDTPISELREKLIDLIKSISNWSDEDLFPSVGIPSFFAHDSTTLGTETGGATTNESPPPRKEDVEAEERDEGKEIIASEEGGDESINRTNKKMIENKLIELDNILKDEGGDV